METRDAYNKDHGKYSCLIENFYRNVLYLSPYGNIGPAIEWIHLERIHMCEGKRKRNS